MTTPLLRHRNAFFALEMARSTRDTVERSSPGTPAAARCEEELGATQKLYEKTAPDPRTIDDLISLAELAVELDSTPHGELDADFAFAALLQLGAVAREILGLPRDGSEDPSGSEEENYRETRLRPELRKIAKEVEARQLGL